jgi:uncharacterized protein (DUF58 family)
MPSGRGLVVFGGAIALWIAARFVGSPDLHIVAVGVAVLPFASALFVRWSRTRLQVTRRLSHTKVRPGQRVTVELEVENDAPTSTSFILVEDKLPPTLGRPARLVLSGIPGRNAQRVSYSMVCRTRGRFSIGPLRMDLSDPFALTKVRLEFAERDDLIVYPEVEELDSTPSSQYGSGAGESASRQLFRTAEEFYTMREYVLGDDLRRIHWPSVARRGKLMIRQDESARRSLATVVLDTRVGAFGQAYTEPFERAVSVAASLGVHLSRGGFALRLAAGQLRPVSVSEDAFLEALSSVSHAPTRPLGTLLVPLRTSAVPDTTLVVVTAPPQPAEVAAMVRVGSVFGPKIASFIHPIDPATLPDGQRATLVDKATTARMSLIRAGWQVFVLPPQGRLQDVWHANWKRLPAAIG